MQGSNAEIFSAIGTTLGSNSYRVKASAVSFICFKLLIYSVPYKKVNFEENQDAVVKTTFRNLNFRFMFESVRVKLACISLQEYVFNNVHCVRALASLTTHFS
jgi:hypothetical protein